MADGDAGMMEPISWLSVGSGLCRFCAQRHPQKLLPGGTPHPVLCFLHGAGHQGQRVGHEGLYIPLSP